MKKKILPYLLLTPMILIMGVLVFYPIAATFSYSLKYWKLTAPNDVHFIRFDNYINILKSESFWYSLQNTVFLLVLILFGTTILGVLLSLFLNIEVKFSGVLLAVAVLPWALPPYVNGILWRFIFYPGYGLMNKLLIGMGVVDQPVEWLNSRWTLLFVVSIVVIWRSIPFMALVCLAGRQSIPHELYEAAKIDGANVPNIFRRITFPLMLPFIGIGVTSTSVTAINVFDEIVALSGYSDLGKNILVESYLTTFSFLDFGKGSAVTYLVMFLAAILGIFYLRSLNKEMVEKSRVCFVLTCIPFSDAWTICVGVYFVYYSGACDACEVGSASSGSSYLEKLSGTVWRKSERTAFVCRYRKFVKSGWHDFVGWDSNLSDECIHVESYGI